MAITLTKMMEWQDTKVRHALFSIAVTANYPTNGEVITAWGTPGNEPPVFAEVYGDTGGYQIQLVSAYARNNPAGTTTKLKSYSAANTEVGAGAYPAGYPATLYLHVVFPKKF